MFDTSRHSRLAVAFDDEEPAGSNRLDFTAPIVGMFERIEELARGSRSPLNLQQSQVRTNPLLLRIKSAVLEEWSLHETKQRFAIGRNR